MKLPDRFILEDAFRGLRPAPMRVGFVVPHVGRYGRVMPSTRIRCYDVIRHFRSAPFAVELFKPRHDYRWVVFQKCFDEEHLRLAVNLKVRGAAVALDINVDYINRDHQSAENQRLAENLRRMMAVSDVVITASPRLREVYSPFHSRTVLIEESIEDRFFRVRKVHTQGDFVTLMYVGYADKARELELIRPVLEDLRTRHALRLLYICERPPENNWFPGVKFIRYRHQRLPVSLLHGDIKLAPRDLSHANSLAHTYTKVAYPLAVGVPAVASPVPSYIGREVVLCETTADWHAALERLIVSSEERNKQGGRGRQYVQAHLSMKTIGRQYERLFTAG